MNLLIGGMASVDIKREMKIQILEVIGDCVSAVGMAAEPYVQNLVNTI